MSDSLNTVFIQRQLDDLRAGNRAGWDHIIAFAIRRLRQLARHMLTNYPHVANFEETDDLLQRGAIRLQQALNKVVPEDAAGLLRLTAQHIRYELIDLARYYRRRQLAPQVPAQHDESSIEVAAHEHASDSTYHPGDLSQWTSVHEAIESMPEELRQVVELIWYHEMSQEEVGRLLSVDRRTIIRRWQKARLLLRDLVPKS